MQLWFLCRLEISGSDCEAIVVHHHHVFPFLLFLSFYFPFLHSRVSFSFSFLFNLSFFLFFYLSKKIIYPMFFLNVFMFLYVAMTNLCPIFFLCLLRINIFSLFFIFVCKKIFAFFTCINHKYVFLVYLFFLSRFTDDKYYSHIFLRIHEWYFNSVFSIGDKHLTQICYVTMINIFPIFFIYNDKYKLFVYYWQMFVLFLHVIITNKTS